MWTERECPILDIVVVTNSWSVPCDKRSWEGRSASWLASFGRFIASQTTPSESTTELTRLEEDITSKRSKKEWPMITGILPPYGWTIWMGNYVWHYTGANWVGSTLLMLTSCAELTVILDCHRLFMTMQCGEQIQMARGRRAGRQSVNPQRPPEKLYCTVQICNHQLIREGGGMVVWNSGLGVLEG